MNALPQQLYHYCCGHSAAAIEDSHGILRPHTTDALYPLPPVVWLTDMEAPDRYGLGLTSLLIECDRTEFRYPVVMAGDLALVVEWWPHFARRYRAYPVVEELEASPGTLPVHWWVATDRIRVGDVESTRPKAAAS